MLESINALKFNEIMGIETTPEVTNPMPMPDPNLQFAADECTGGGCKLIGVQDESGPGTGAYGGGYQNVYQTWDSDSGSTLNGVGTTVGASFGGWWSWKTY